MMLVLGIVIGFTMGSLLWHSIVRSVWDDYKRVAADERRYFRLYVEAVRPPRVTKPGDRGECQPCRVEMHAACNAGECGCECDGGTVDLTRPSYDDVV